jgi:hypothetical protein
MIDMAVRIATMHVLMIFFLPLAPLGSLLTLWSIGLISQFLDHSQTVGLLGRVISSSQGLYLNTEHKHRKTHTHQTSMP